MRELVFLKNIQRNVILLELNWEEVKKYEIDDKIDKSLGVKPPEEAGGMGLGSMGGYGMGGGGGSLVYNEVKNK